MLHRRRRARPDAAARARGRALDPRRRPHAADPRHLRPARRQRRGQAPGRARAARVQPAAHARHVAAPRAPRRRRRHARPRRVAARERPPHGPTPDRALRARLKALQAQRGVEAQGAQARRDPDRRARRLHERRQVDAAERAHRRRGVGREPALRDARPDDARLRVRRQALSRHRHGRLHPPAADPARARASPRRSRRRSSPTSMLHVADASLPEDRLREQIAAVDAVLTEIGGDELPDRARPQQGRPARPARPPPARNRFPERCWSRPPRARASTSCASASPTLFADRFEDVRLLVPYDEGTALVGALRARRADRGARRHGRRRADPRQLLAPRRAPLRRYLVAGDGLESAATT